MDEKLRNLKARISEAKDTPEMVYAALFFSDAGMADEVLGPDEGRARLAELCGYRVVEDDDTGQVDLMSAAGRH